MNVLAKRITRKQSGAALIAFLLVFITAASFKLLKGLNVAATKQHSDAQTAKALAEAKAALIGYAASDSNRPGELPCPDVNNDGSSLLAEYSGLNCTRLLGWFPWKTLRLPVTADGAAERLWYAVSDDYHAGDPAKLNSDLPGQLTVDGVNDVVAVILAPLEPVGGQSAGRPGTDAEADVDKYLEGINSNVDLTDYTSSGSDEFNDRLITITRRELMVPTERRVAGELSNVLRNYYESSSTISSARYYPYASEFDDDTYKCTPDELHGHLPLTIVADCPTLTDWGGTAILPTWFQPNDWHTVTYYAVASSCTNTPPGPGCTGALLTVNNSSPPVNNKQAVVVMTGQELAGQNRPSPNVVHYLEGENATPNDDIFEKIAGSTTFDDVVTVVAP